MPTFGSEWDYEEGFFPGRWIIFHVRFSNRPVGVKALTDYPPLQCRCRSRARASLRHRHEGRSTMGFEDEVEQSSLIGQLGSRRLQTIRRCSVDVAHGLALLFGIGTRAVPPWDSKTRWNNLRCGLIVNVATGPSGHTILTSSIVPRGTSFHRRVELGFPPIGFNLVTVSCCWRGLFPGPPKLGAVNPYAVHDHGQPTCQRHDRFFHPAAPGDLHRPGLEP